MKTFLLVLLLAPALLAASPNPLQCDLGQGLAYYRVHILPADLPVTTTKPGAVVLDLRYAHGDDNAADALGTWLKSHSSATTPVFVLVNAGTAPAALAYFSAHDPAAGLVTLGTLSPRFVPDIVVKFSPTAERAAYDAFEHGVAVGTLLRDNSVKLRHDEAALAQDRNAPPPEETTDSDLDLAGAPGTAAVTPVPPPPVIDYALLRAVQLDRALLALRKL